MKKIILRYSLLLITTIFLSNESFSQCKAEKDPITGEMVLNYKFGEALSYTVKDTGIYFEMMFNYIGQLNVVAKAGNSLFFKFENGDILEFKTTNDAHPVTKVSGATVFTNYTYQTLFTKSAIETISSSKVVLVRYPDLKGGFTDIELTGLRKKFAKKIQEGATCIKDNLK
jgi:hypothetical protein